MSFTPAEKWAQRVLLTTISFVKTAAPFVLPVAIMGIIVNFFHILVLSRKSMRSNGINVIMIGIGISDIYNLFFKLYSDYFLSTLVNDCYDDFRDAHPILHDIIGKFSTTFIRMSSCLPVVMATIRLLAIKYPLNSKFDALTTCGFAFKSNLIVFFLCSLFDIIRCFFIRIQHKTIVPEEYCGYPENHTIDVVTLANSAFLDDFDVYSFIVFMWPGLFKAIPSISLPILSFLLILELRKAAQARKQFMTSESSKNSSQNQKVIAYVTIASFIAETPDGAASFINAIGQVAGQRLLFMYIGYSISYYMKYFQLLNTFSHFLVCLAISSQYKATIVSMLPCLKSLEKKPKIVGNGLN